MSYIVYAIPAFLLLIGLELAITRAQEKDFYSLADSLTDLGCGLVQQLVEVALKTFLFAGYLYLYAHHRLFDVPMKSIAAWAGCLLALDFMYYWFHRKSHEVNAFWAAHVVHHSSEEYNLAVALRQGTFQQAFSWIFYLPLALAGFPPVMFLTVSSIDTLYQFWVHTRAIGKLGPLEGILTRRRTIASTTGATPSTSTATTAGSSSSGTACSAPTPPRRRSRSTASPRRCGAGIRCGRTCTTGPSCSPTRGARRGRWTRCGCSWPPPGWRPDDLGGHQHPPEVDRATATPFASTASAGLHAYVVVQFVVALALGILFLVRHDAWTAGARGAAAAYVIVTLVACAGLLERQRWAVPFEIARLVAAVPLVHAASLAWPLARASWAPAALTAAAVIVASVLVLRITAPLAAPTTERTA